MSTIVLATPEYRRQGNHFFYDQGLVDRLATDIHLLTRQYPIPVASRDDFASKLAVYFSDCWGHGCIEIDDRLSQGNDFDGLEQLRRGLVGRHGSVLFLAEHPIVSRVAHHTAKQYAHEFAGRLVPGTGVYLDTRGVVDLPRARSVIDRSLLELETEV